MISKTATVAAAASRPNINEIKRFFDRLGENGHRTAGAIDDRNVVGADRPSNANVFVLLQQAIIE